MNIAIYGRNFATGFNGMAIQLFEELKNHGVKLYIKDKFNDFLNKKLRYFPVIEDVFSDSLPIGVEFNLMLSIGGDGTFLETATYVKDSGIPVLGINTGRLGFLAYVNASNLIWAIKQFFNNEYSINKRMLLTIDCDEKFYGKTNFCLNEFTIQKSSRLKMVKIKVYADDNYINTYWSDGIIISTPTGSTAYSLSCGGPIIEPNADAIVITPIANHNLTVRPLVLSGDSIIKVLVDSNDERIMSSLDYRTYSLSDKLLKNKEIQIKKADFYIKFVTLLKNNYFSTLRNKLMWGTDIRN
jgi:NAD+ kinase